MPQALDEVRAISRSKGLRHKENWTPIQGEEHITDKDRHKKNPNSLLLWRTCWQSTMEESQSTGSHWGGGLEESMDA